MTSSSRRPGSGVRCGRLVTGGLALASSLLGFEADAAAQVQRIEIRITFELDDDISPLGARQIDAAAVPLGAIATELADAAQVAFPYHTWQGGEVTPADAGLRVRLMNGEGAAQSRWWLAYEAKLAGSSSWEDVAVPDRCTTVWERRNAPPDDETGTEFATALSEFFVRALRGEEVSSTPGDQLDCTVGDQRLRAIEEALTARVPVTTVTVGSGETIDLGNVFSGIAFRQNSLLALEVTDPIQNRILVDFRPVGGGFVRLGRCQLGEQWGRASGEWGETPGLERGPPPPLTAGARVRAYVSKYRRPFLDDSSDQVSRCFTSGSEGRLR